MHSKTSDFRNRKILCEIPFLPSQAGRRSRNTNRPTVTPQLSVGHVLSSENHSGGTESRCAVPTGTCPDQRGGLLCDFFPCQLCLSATNQQPGRTRIHQQANGVVPNPPLHGKEWSNRFERNGFSGHRNMSKSNCLVVIVNRKVATADGVLSRSRNSAFMDRQ